MKYLIILNFKPKFLDFTVTDYYCSVLENFESSRVWVIFN